MVVDLSGLLTLKSLSAEHCDFLSDGGEESEADMDAGLLPGPRFSSAKGDARLWPTLRALLFVTGAITFLLLSSLTVNVLQWSQSRAPASPPPPSGPVRHVAHCFAGHVRTMWFPEIYTLYKANVLDALGPNVEHTLYLVSDYSPPPDSHGSPYEHWPKDFFNDSIANFNFAKVVWLNEPHPYADLLGNQCGYAQWRICHALIADTERQRGFVFDRIIRSRPDIAVVRALPTLDQLPVNVSLLPPYYEHAATLPGSYFNVSAHWKSHAWNDPTNDRMGVNDMFAILTRSAADVYFNTAVISGDWTADQVRPYCWNAVDACECRPKVALTIHKVPYEVSPLLIKIRRPFSWCKHYTVTLPFNVIC